MSAARTLLPWPGGGRPAWVAAALVALAACEQSSPLERARDGMVAEAEARLRDGARNPDSVEFRGTHVAPRPALGRTVVCGEFNGENGLGGMTGFTRFVMFDGKVPLVYSAESRRVFDDAWSTAGC